MLNKFITEKDKSLTLILSAFFIIVAALLLWAAIFQINDFVRGYGKIVPSGKSRIVQHMEGGIVTEINAREGNIVERGDIIMSIDNTEAQTSLDELRIEAQAYNTQIMRLRAELEGEEEFTLPPGTQLQNDDIYNAERALFNSRRRQLEEQLSGLNEQIAQKQYRIEELSSRVGNITEELKIARQKHDILLQLNRTGAASNSRVLESESVIQNFITRVAEARDQIPVYQSEINELRNRITETQQGYESDIFEELSDLQTRKQKITERLKNNTQRLSRTDIVSPVDGIIKNMRFNTIGGVISPGDVVAEITPQDETLIVEARIANNDRDLIWINQDARVKINAFDSRRTSTFAGNITNISSDSLSDENNGSYYRVMITLDDVVSADDDMVIYPGMSTEINIISGERSILSYLFRPMRAMQERAFGL